MRVKTFTMTVTYKDGFKNVYSGLSRVAVKRYREWFEDEPFVSNIVVQEG